MMDSKAALGMDVGLDEGLHYGPYLLDYIGSMSLGLARNAGCSPNR